MASDYVYEAGATVNKVFKLLKADMSKVAESASYGGTIFALCEDDDYVYCAGATTQKVWKIRKSDMFKVAESANYGGTIYALSQDTNFVYCGGATTLKVWKMQKSDMVKVAESEALASSSIIYAVINDTNYVYWCGYRTSTATTNRVVKAQKSDLAILGSYAWYPSASATLIPRALAQDTNYIYAGGVYLNVSLTSVRKLQKSDMTLIAYSADYGGIVYALATDEGDFLYVGGATTQKVWKILKSTMAKDSESASFGKNIYGLALNTEYLYVVG